MRKFPSDFRICRSVSWNFAWKSCCWRTFKSLHFLFRSYQ